MAYSQEALNDSHEFHLERLVQSNGRDVKNVDLNQTPKLVWRATRVRVTHGQLHIRDQAIDTMNWAPNVFNLVRTKLCGVQGRGHVAGRQFVVQITSSATGKIVSPVSTIRRFYFATRDFEELTRCINVFQNAVSGGQRRPRSMHKMVQATDLRGVLIMLEAEPTVANETNPYGSTPLHLAVRVAIGAVADDDVQMALHEGIIRALLSSGADPYAKALDGQSPMAMVGNCRSKVCNSIKKLLNTTSLRWVN